MSDTKIIKKKLIAAEQALSLINVANPEGENSELIDEIRGMLSEAMEILDNQE